MSVTTSWWATLKEWAAAFVSAGYADRYEYARRPGKVPMGVRTVLHLEPVRAGEEKPGGARIPVWSGTYRLTILQRTTRTEAPADYDPFAGDGADPGYAALIDLVKDTLDPILSPAVCEWSWAPVTYRWAETETGQAEVELTISHPVHTTDRGQGVAPVVSVPAGLAVAGIQDSEIIYWSAEDGAWRALTGSFADPGQGTPALSLSQLQLTPRAPIAGDPGSGIIYVATDATLRYVVAGVQYKVTGTPV